MSLEVALPALVVRPELSFAELDERLEGAGFLLGEESQEPPLLPGEPHWCEFYRRDVKVRVLYTFDPVVKLRTLAFSGDAAAEVRGAVAGLVPLLESARVSQLLDSEDEREVLLALFAAAATHDLALLGRVRILEQDERPRVAEAARRAREQILPAPLAEGLDRLLAEKGAHRDRSALFGHFGGPEQRRQILRWFVRDFTEDNPSIDEVLRSGFVDRDPEVRITAVLAAARLGAKAVLPALAECELPETTAAGADPRERRLYVLLRDSALKYLDAHARGALPKGPRETWPPLLQALSGPMPVVDEMTLLVHALTTPLELGEVRDPPQLSTEWPLSLRALGPIPHFVGHVLRPGAPEPELESELRAITPQEGVCIAREPLPDSQSGAPALLGRDQVDAWLARLEAPGWRVRLPTADEWEMAMRGPDGRLFPWGNNLASTARGAASPWGVNPARTLEWTSDVARGQPVVVGGTGVDPVSRRKLAASDTLAALRVVVEAS